MPTPKTTLRAIFPEPVQSGPYLISPPTLLHLAALDRVGCSVSAGIGADAAATAGFVLTRKFDELRELMALPRQEFSARGCEWAAGQRAADLPALRDGVVRAVNAAFETAVPGAGSDPTPGHPPSSDGPLKSPRR